MEDIFAGTAEYYDKFRPGIPAGARDYILSTVKIPITLLDLGTGTGRVLEQFAPYFNDIIAVEPDHEMVKLARKRLMPYPAHILETTAENMRLPDDWHASLVTIAKAFHWMDRELVLKKLDSVVAPDGVIAVFHDHSFWNLKNEWCDAVRDVIQEFLGNKRRAGRGTYHRPLKPYSQDFARSSFTRYHKETLPIERHWNTEQIIGMLYSTSFASKALLGERASRFEEKIHAALEQLSAQDDFIEHNALEIFIARRPG